MAHAPSPPVRRTPALVVTAAALLVLLTAATAAAVNRPTEPRKLTLISTANGAALADMRGNPLYLREADKPNRPGCTGRCAKTFPPAVGSPSRGRGVTGRVTHTPHHAPGSRLPQVVYVRHPLYYYAKDHPKRPRGQEVDGFHLVAPDGSPLPTGEIGTATSRPESPTARPSRPSHSKDPHAPRPRPTATHRPATPPRTRAPGAVTPPHAQESRPSAHRPQSPAPGQHTAGATAPPPPPAARPTPSSHTHPATATSRTPATGTRTEPGTKTGPGTGTLPGTGTGTLPGTGATARATAPTSPEPTLRRGTATAAVGALQATPSGAANGGAVHPVTATAADRARASDAADIALAAGAATAAAAGTLVVVRRLRKGATGGAH
jgi:predicted lipoprotein with Yx(FWY)xxD motif